MFERTIKLIGEENLEKIQSKTVLVVGVGGVGGTAVEALVRSGITNFIIIDNDIFKESNLNRQIICTNNNLEMKKTEGCLKRICSINKDAVVTPLDIFLTSDNINLLDEYHIDYIIDACDSVNAKISLIKYAKNNNIKIISSMGTGKKLDPRNVIITKLNKTFNDPLAKVMRRKLREENIDLNIDVVTSTSDAIKTNDNIIPSMIFTPSTAGLYLAYFVINDILNN